MLPVPSPDIRISKEVKDRLEKKLQHHFQSTADDQDEGITTYL